MISITSLSKKQILIALAIVCQILALSNGIMTIVVDYLSKQSLADIFQNHLPEFTLLYSLCWRNWKLMESVAENLVLGGNSVTYMAQTNLHLPAISYEQSFSNAESKKLEEAVTRISDLTKDCYSAKNFTKAFDENLLEINSLGIAAVKKNGQYMLGELESLQRNALHTLYVNSVALGLISILRIAQIVVYPRESTDIKAISAYWTGTTSMFMLSALESIAFIILTKIRLTYIEKVVKNDYPLYEAAWQIKYLDPILTGSAFRYTFSQGDPAWSERYEAALKPLDAALYITNNVTSPKIIGLKEINAVANSVLIDLETIALRNYSQGAESLTGLNYTSNKNIYLFAVDSMLMYQEREIYAGLSSTQSICEALLFFAIILTIMSILMFIADGTRLLSELRLTGEKSASSQESGTSKVAPLAGIKVTPLIRDSKGE